MTKILHVLGGLENGGAESFLLNYYTKLSREDYHIEFLLRTSNNNKNVIDVFEKLGDRINIVPSFPKHFITNFKSTNKIIKHGKYDVVHIHANALIYILPLILSKKYNVKKRILHCHNTKSNFVLGKYAHLLNRFLFLNKANELVACGQEAGHWMFGNRKFAIINNAIDFEKYRFRSEYRKKVREELEVDEQIKIIGHVGRFTKQKNHVFLLKMFKIISNNIDDIHLVLVGIGEEYTKIYNMAKEMNIVQKISFLGHREEVNQIYSSFDCLVFPSLYEGLPFTLIEAQANGLPIITSNKISREVEFNENIIYKELTSENDWVNEVLQMCKLERLDSNKVYENMCQAGFEVKRNMKKIEDLYR